MIYRPDDADFQGEKMLVEDKNHAVIIKDGSFSWSAVDKTVVHNTTSNEMVSHIHMYMRTFI
jgi:hypothetical protein